MKKKNQQESLNPELKESKDKWKNLQSKVFIKELEYDIIKNMDMN